MNDKVACLAGTTPEAAMMARKIDSWSLDGSSYPSVAAGKKQRCVRRASRSNQLNKRTSHALIASHLSSTKMVITTVISTTAPVRRYWARFLFMGMVAGGRAPAAGVDDWTYGTDMTYQAL